MSMISLATQTVERFPLPDAVTQLGVSFLVSRTGRRLARGAGEDNAAFARAMQAHPIAEYAQAANDQHYELPPAFFRSFLGPRLKYSCCLFESETTTLAEAEISALATTSERARLSDGQQILELGCGWGSLSLWIAERYRGAEITAVSNSALQGAFIRAEAARLGLGNLRVITADMNGFAPDRRFDRVVSVEMFEHMANWPALLGRIRNWLTPQGALFLHVFAHKTFPYRFDHRNEGDWIAQHFFTGGIMPSQGLLREFGDLFSIRDEWRWSGRHYALTAMRWLENFDANRASVDPILKQTYGAEAALWTRRWRLFLLATAGLFGYQDGDPWGVSHYLLEPAGT